MNGDVDHVKWLRLQASRFELAAEGEQDEKKGKGKVEMARKLRNAANALELALAGVDPGAMGGHAGILKRLRPGAPVRVQLMTGQELVGEMRAMGRYDFALKTERAELVVPKHAVVWWELLATGDDAHLGEPQGNGELNDE
jgi:sRNA-binding regulator protein Hfq